VPHVVATAGHVDHGKSALIRALTGTDPDRLAEEKARGMTIDLGFAWARLPSGREVGFVDVPGHERFVHNMLAGVGAVSCALLVVDATEGWRPQSEEHLAILELVGTGAGVVALAKGDLAGPAARAGAAAAVRARLAVTRLAGADLVVTSAPTGEGLDELRAALDRALDRAGEPPDRGRPRLAVDRVFSVKGAGTVVTGTLAGGPLVPDSEAELLTGGRRVRVRALEGHGRRLERAAPVQRLAANLAGVGTGEVARGDVLALPGHWRATRTADARVRCLDGAPAPLTGRGAYLLYAGTAASAVRLQPLDAHAIRPGESALVRLHLERPLLLDAFEPVVLRDSGRGGTVGGGPVLDPFPAGRVHGSAARVRRAEQLEAREADGRDGLLACALAELGAAPLADLPLLAATGPERAAAVLGRLVAAGGARRTRATAWSAAAFERARRAVLDAVAAGHRRDPLAPGLPIAAARHAAAAAVADARPAPSAAGRTATPAPRATPPGADGTTGSFAVPQAGAEVVEALVASGELVADGPVVRLPGQAVRMDPREQAVRRRVEAALTAAGIAVLGEGELAALGADRRLTAALARLGVLVRLTPALWIGGEALAAATRRLRAAFAGRAFTAGEARQALGTNRRAVIPLLEHLDRTGVTARAGDQRRLRAGPDASGPGTRRSRLPG